MTKKTFNTVLMIAVLLVTLSMGASAVYACDDCDSNSTCGGEVNKGSLLGDLKVEINPGHHSKDIRPLVKDNDRFTAGACTSCWGSGKCRICWGSGKDNSGSVCYTCNGSGKCYVCSGTGNL